jgi:hypothetical protein
MTRNDGAADRTTRFVAQAALLWNQYHNFAHVQPRTGNLGYMGDVSKVIFSARPNCRANLRYETVLRKPRLPNLAIACETSLPAIPQLQWMIRVSGTRATGSRW